MKKIIQKFRGLLKNRKIKSGSEIRGYVVHIHGGLGGQILDYALMKYLQKTSPLPVVGEAAHLLNSNTYRLAGPGEGLNINTWNLGYYGIQLQEGVEIFKKIESIPPNFKLFNARFEDTADIGFQPVRSLGPGHFPVRSDHRAQIEQQYGSQKILVAHVRQSDYLNVSSLVLSAEKTAHFVKRLLSLRPDRIIFCSDGKLDTPMLGRIVGRPVEGLVCDDFFLVHALFRRADILITANSQFSVSAGLLEDRILTFYPKKYFGENYPHYNQAYQKNFEYFVD